MRLGDYLRTAAERKGDFGQHDCCTFVAQWVIICGYPDPMADFRGRYTSEAGAARLLIRRRGLLNVARRGMASAGVPAYEGAPEPGDVAVVESKGVDVGGIFTGERWAVLLNGGGMAFYPDLPVRQLWGPARG